MPAEVSTLLGRRGLRLEPQGTSYVDGDVVETGRGEVEKGEEMNENVEGGVEKGEVTQNVHGEVVDLHVEGEIERGEEMIENVEGEVENREMTQNVHGDVVNLPPIRLTRCLRKATPESLAYDFLDHVMACRTQSDCNN